MNNFPYSFQFCIFYETKPFLEIRMADSDEKTELIKTGIKRKLFIRPVSHDCFRRLSDAEKNFISNNAGFTDIEWKIFTCRCKGMTFGEISKKLGYHPRYCQTISSRVKNMISYLIE